MSDAPQPLERDDYYWDDGKMVLTARYHLRRGTCCGNGCRHCPFRMSRDVMESAGFGGPPPSSESQ